MVGVAVIGCGYWGPNVVRNFSSLAGCELRYVCDLDDARIEPLRALYPAVSGVNDVAAVLDDPKVDAVAICTPIHTHALLAELALEAGKHVLVEKPLTHTVESAERLVAIAKTKDLVLQVDHTFTYSPAVQMIRAMLDEGQLGDLLYLDSVRINLGLFRSDVSVIWDLAAHDISIINHLVDSAPTSVSATGCSHYGELENLAYITLMYPESLIAHIHVNWLAPVKIRSTLVGGSKQMIVYDDLAPSEKVRVYDRGVSLNGGEQARERALVDYRLGSMIAPHIEKVEPLRAVCEDFIHAIENDCAPLSDGLAGLAVVRVLAAAEESIRKNGEPIVFAGH
jgi:predicted dehydrogenase